MRCLRLEKYRRHFHLIIFFFHNLFMKGKNIDMIIQFFHPSFSSTV